MNETIIKFKKELKQHQLQRKQFLHNAEQELVILEKLKNKDKTVNDYLEPDIENISDKLEIFVEFFLSYRTSKKIKKSIKHFNLKNLFKQTKEDDITDEEFYDGIDSFKNFIQTGKKVYAISQEIINAFDNDKIKDPINNLDILIEHFKQTSLTIEESNKILGMAIAFNSQFALKNKKHQIINIELIHTLANYYNLDGSFKYNEDLNTFEQTIHELLYQSTNDKSQILESIFFNGVFDIDSLVYLLNNHNMSYNDSTKNLKKEDPIKEENTPIKKRILT